MHPFENLNKTRDLPSPGKKKCQNIYPQNFLAFFESVSVLYISFICVISFYILHVRDVM